MQLKTRVELLAHGHFQNWYRTLPKRGDIYASVEQKIENPNTAGYGPAGGYDVPPYEEICNKKFSILDLLKFLPDLDADLQRFGVEVPRSRVSHNIVQTTGYVHHTWRFHDCRTQQHREKLLAEFHIGPELQNGFTRIAEDKNVHAIVTLNFDNKFASKFTWPTTRETLNHDTIAYAGSPETHELTDLYLVAYQLSMLSRYYPDIWVSCIESQCKGTKLIEQVVQLVIKKLPILALSMLGSEDIVISTHRPPWSGL